MTDYENNDTTTTGGVCPDGGDHTATDSVIDAVEQESAVGQESMPDVDAIAQHISGVLTHLSTARKNAVDAEAAAAASRAEYDRLISEAATDGLITPELLKRFGHDISPAAPRRRANRARGATRRSSPRRAEAAPVE